MFTILIIEFALGVVVGVVVVRKYPSVVEVAEKLVRDLKARFK